MLCACGRFTDLRPETAPYAIRGKLICGYICFLKHGGTQKLGFHNGVPDGYIAHSDECRCNACMEKGR